MILRWGRIAAVLACLLLASRLLAQFTFPAQKFDDVKAELTVEVATRMVEHGVGAATLTLTISGPATMEVEPPRLGDAAAAWKDERSGGTPEVHEGRAVWSQVIRLRQVKPGLESLPDLTVRFRRGPDADWSEAKWTNILRKMREMPNPPVEEIAEQPSWPRRWWFALVLAAVVLVLLVWLIMRRHARRTAPLPPHRWALGELERIERTLTPPQGDAETFHVQLSFVVRRYLAERFGLQALQQTTAEFLASLRRVPQVTAAQQTMLHKSSFQGNAAEMDPQLSAEQQRLLADLFERCDLVKFAQAELSADECRHTAALARELIRQTTPAARGIERG